MVGILTPLENMFIRKYMLSTRGRNINDAAVGSLKTVFISFKVKAVIGLFKNSLEAIILDAFKPYARYIGEISLCQYWLKTLL